MPDLACMFLAVSCLSLASQVAACIRLAVQRARTPTEKLVSSGYMRTAACRVIAAVTYVAVAAIQVAGDGALTAEALIVFGAIQFLWVSNSVMDLRIRRVLARHDDG